MDIVAILRKKTSTLDSGEHSAGLKATLSHIEMLLLFTDEYLTGSAALAPIAPFLINKDIDLVEPANNLQRIPSSARVLFRSAVGPVSGDPSRLQTASRKTRTN